MGTINAPEKFVAFAPPLMGDEEINEVADTLRSGWLTTGPKTEKFEKSLCEYIGTNKGVPVNSCTSALHLAVHTLGLGPGQGVITTPLTFASTAHVIMYQQARPYFADIDPETGNLDPVEVRRFLETECEDFNGRPRHKLTGDLITTLMPVHYGGHAVDLEEFWQIAVKYNLNMVEDAAHAIGSRYKNLPIGHPELRPEEASHLKSFTTFSFYATKNLSTGEGGFISGPDDGLVERARVMSMYGISDSRRIWGRYSPKGTWVYDVADLGFKYNMMDIQAALGLHQLAKLPDFISRRAAHAETYNKVLSGLEDLVIPPKTKPDIGHAWHLYPLRLKPEALKIGRDEFIETLRDHNVGSSVLFIPLHYHSYYRDRLEYQEGSFPQAENFFKNLINLPVAPAHSPELIRQVAEVVAAILEKHRK
ncbi:UDP-4-amino-4,6-dideoxy-N-acetyl-beta-L-altrosamine transaminase [Deltaproteobacteria bacterium Smac51]|nr:UDP-4-amino-4,6-dideoxy-N-acetyl-beta-L-altrosamine transaminase [Deltaproteobacteria bacterium Smac51]